ncbi:M23 family metallopeptidase [Salinimicrobium xinjiangense]|uniref:M23 family metallopeptidase n=1 Tax=Salinimicrobium xinjiangense TaxID=438596 RepID=UPI0003FDFEBA|nr:M23 family metallopeptidase [Salinimicrobium xinjiangense]
MKISIRVLCLLIFLSGCKTAPPREPVTPIPITAQAAASYDIQDEELELKLTNFLKAPIRFYVSAQQSNLNPLLENLQPVLLPPGKDTIIKIPLKEHTNLQPVFKVDYGDLNHPVIHSPVALPVTRNKAVKILQGHNGKYSHNQDRSRYAIDFKLNIKDTVYSASSGFVVQMMEEYKYGGNDIRWLNLGNRILVYDPSTGRFFQYSHLVQRGSFVKQGDWVTQGQAIGLSGNTGFSDTPHLHFNVMVPDTTADGFRSVPVDFTEGFKGEDLKKNVILRPI